ncbi:MAG: hypothetical protein RSF73_09135, partial [Ruthenibacterium sp.]
LRYACTGTPLCLVTEYSSTPEIASKTAAFRGYSVDIRLFFSPHMDWQENKAGNLCLERKFGGVRRQNSIAAPMKKSSSV